MEKFKIKHIFHSGFHIEYKNKIILFDVFNHLDQYENQDIICFVTHSHSDHYNPAIQDLMKKNKVVYIVSEDVPMTVGENVYKVKQGDQLSVEGFDIKVFGTTDLGVSYLVQVGKESIFHAGDLNWWHWENNEVSAQQHEKALYQHEIEKLIGHVVDFAFIPVDYRLKTFSRLGMDYFIEKLAPSYVIPMHFAEEYDTIQHLKSKSNAKLLKSEYPNSYIF